jgi:NAD(P)-dependent dehydrogenase (short-subunit alcohol dehydrogenase family)
MTDSLAGRVAIVTGAGGAIGRAIAGSLARHGARIVVADTGATIAGDGGDPTVARDVASALGGGAIAFTESIASPGAAAQLVDLAVRSHGRLDIVVHNAAIQREAPVGGLSPMDWDAVIRTNLSAAFYLINAATAVMLRQNNPAGGRIVNIASPAGLSGSPGQAAPASAAAGLIGLTRSTAMDLAPARITANAIIPVASDAGLDAGAQAVANLVAALCLPAGGAISGQLLDVHGREVFQFGQPRPVGKLDVAPADTGAQELLARLADTFATGDS